MTRSTERHVLQFCHGYDGPFLDCARQYASLFAGTGYKVTTVFLTGAADQADRDFLKALSEPAADAIFAAQGFKVMK